jgi:hypothetical protein
MENKAVPRYSFTAVILGVGILALLPLLIKQASRMATYPIWWFSPLALGLFAFLIWRTNYVGVAANPTRRWSAKVVVALGAFAGLAAAIAESANLAQLSVLLLITGWALIRQGIVPWTRVLACCSVLWVAWPLPYAMTERVSSRINREAIKTASGVLDQLDFKHLATPSALDLKTTRLELAPILDHAGSLPALLFVTLAVLLFTRHPLLLGLMTLASAFVISWLGDVLLVLLQVWAVQSMQANWDSGWPLIATQASVFIAELMLVGVSLFSISYLFDGVPVDSTQQADKGWHGVYNRLVVWPLNFVAIQDEDTQAYIEEEEFEEASKQGAATNARNTPSFAATRAAVDPFSSELRLSYSVLACIAVAGILAVLGWLIPPTAIDLKALAQSATQMEDIQSAPSEIAGFALVGQENLLTDDESLRATAWDYSRPGSVASLTLEYPRIGPNSARAIEGWSPVGVPQLYIVDGWNMLEAEYVDTIGNRSYGWTTALNRDGSNYSQGGTIGRIIRRLKRTVIGRVLGLAVDDVTYHSRLIVQPQGPLSMQQREKLRSAFVSATKAIGE